MATNSKSQFQCPVGSEFQLQWPQILGVLSVTSVEQVQTLLKSNPETTVTEKLDGSNLCLSSENWVASRRRVILDRPSEEELKKTKFCGENLSSLSSVFPKLNALADEVKKHFPHLELEVLLYGEWIQKGTASSAQDLYSYVNRGFKAGHIYAFGLAIHFGKILDDSETGKIEKVLKDDLHWNSITVKVPVQFFVICMNKRLEAFLKGYDLASVPLLGELPFHEALSPDKFVDKLVNRDYEGYVFSVPSMLLKWKAFEEGERSSQEDALKTLLTRLADDISLTDILKTLSNVCYSSAPEDKQKGPRQKPSKGLYSRLFESAASKYPTLPDYLLPDKSSNNEEIVETLKSYESTIYVEMSKDFVDAGYTLDNDYDKEIKGFIRGRVKSEAAKTLKRKINLD